jgi:hypothetical protein
MVSLSSLLFNFYKLKKINNVDFIDNFPLEKVQQIFQDKTHKNLDKKLCLLSYLIYFYNDKILFNKFLLEWNIKFNVYCVDKGIDDNYTLIFGVYEMENELVVIFKGTSNIEDNMNNINFGKSTIPDIPGRVHSGFKSILFEMNNDTQTPNILEILNILDTYPNTTKIHISGHSLGGAISTIFYSYLLYYRSFPLNLVTFGSPRVGNKLFCDNIKGIRYVNNNDIIPHLPLKIGLNLKCTSSDYNSYNDYKEKIHLKNKYIDSYFWSIKDHSICEYFKNLI